MHYYFGDSQKLYADRRWLYYGWGGRYKGGSGFLLFEILRFPGFERKTPIENWGYKKKNQNLANRVPCNRVKRGGGGGLEALYKLNDNIRTYVYT